LIVPIENTQMKLNTKKLAVDTNVLLWTFYENTTYIQAYQKEYYPVFLANAIENGRCKIQYGVKGGEDRAEHDCCKEAHDRLRNDFRNQRRVCKVDCLAARRRQRILDGGQIKRDDTGDDQIERPETFEEAAEDCTLLPFLQRLRRQ